MRIQGRTFQGVEFILSISFSKSEDGLAFLVYNTGMPSLLSNPNRPTPQQTAGRRSIMFGYRGTCCRSGYDALTMTAVSRTGGDFPRSAVPLVPTKQQWLRRCARTTVEIESTVVAYAAATLTTAKFRRVGIDRARESLSDGQPSSILRDARNQGSSSAAAENTSEKLRKPLRQNKTTLSYEEAIFFFFFFFPLPRLRGTVQGFLSVIAAAPFQTTRAP